MRVLGTWIAMDRSGQASDSLVRNSAFHEVIKVRISRTTFACLGCRPKQAERRPRLRRMPIGGCSHRAAALELEATAFAGHARPAGRPRLLRGPAGVRRTGQRLPFGRAKVVRWVTGVSNQEEA